MKNELTNTQISELLGILKKRFEENMHRHKSVEWERVEPALMKKSEKLWSLHAMEATGGEPDIIVLDKMVSNFVFCDCSKQSPMGRKSLCYDEKALKSRKGNPPGGSVMEMAKSMGVEVLNEEQYRKLQEIESYDTTTSSWLKTPDDIRMLGGAIFGDFRYGNVFVYHNGAASYYSSRGFRGFLNL
ncbi:MAG: DUF4256 domain-containing protein [Sphingobacteriales bacterium]|jgi:hypothetical protein|nr:DUF4256 domain-containing protein [Sphingobacteriales bacterium]